MIIILLIAFIMTLLALRFLIKPATHINLVDHPDDHRRHHHKVTPLIGGIGMLFGMVIGWLLIDMSLESYRILFVTLAIAAFFGVLDDLHELSHKARFVIQFVLAFFIAHLGQQVLTSLGVLMFSGDIQLGVWGLPFTILALVGLMNAVNMSDGIDGLAGFQSFVAFLLLAFLAWHAGALFDLKFLLVILAALAGFLVFNFPFFNRKAVMFMGDVGSSMMAVLLGWFLIKFTQQPAAIIRPVTALWIVALPLCDIVSVIYRRLRQKRSPFKGDREHLHHILLGLNFKPQTVTLLISFATLILGLCGIVMDVLKCPDTTIFLSFCGLFVLYLFLVNHPDDIMQVVRRKIKRTKG